MLMCLLFGKYNNITLGRDHENKFLVYEYSFEWCFHFLFSQNQFFVLFMEFLNYNSYNECWAHDRANIQFCSLPWSLIGDVNEIIKAVDKEGGRSARSPSTQPICVFKWVIGSWVCGQPLYIKQHETWSPCNLRKIRHLQK